MAARLLPPKPFKHVIVVTRVRVVGPAPYRKSAFDRFFAGRGQGTDRRPGAGRSADVELNRTSDSYRYPDRREGMG
jgi:hypothetical protein